MDLPSISGLIDVIQAVAEDKQVAEAEHEETPFYIAGGVFAVFAVLVGVWGIVTKGGPEGINRVIMAVALVLMLVVMAMAVISSG